MATYKPRTSEPSTKDKNYIHFGDGGYNYCIEIKNGSCLPNCVGYAWGRWRELLGKYHNLSRANAENWWGYTADGYKRGQTPKLGAVICWRKGKVGVASDGAGHVGIVEKITSNSVVVSMSAYGGTRWFTRTFKKGSYDYNGFVFQGFIYPPVNFKEEEKKESKPTTTTAKVKKSYTGTYPKLPARGYFKTGDKGTQVRYLQKFLNWYGGYNLVVDGDFGAKTFEAVKNFQKKTGLTVDGLFGAKSLAKAKTIKK